MIEMTQKISTPLTINNLTCVASERFAFPVIHRLAAEVEDQQRIRVR